MPGFSTLVANVLKDRVTLLVRSKDRQVEPSHAPVLLERCDELCNFFGFEDCTGLHWFILKDERRDIFVIESLTRWYRRTFVVAWVVLVYVLIPTGMRMCMVICGRRMIPRGILIAFLIVVEVVVVVEVIVFVGASLTVLPPRKLAVRIEARKDDGAICIVVPSAVKWYLIKCPLI